MHLLTTLLLATPAAAQVDEPFHFESAPRWYDVGLVQGRWDPEPMAEIDLDQDGDLDLARSLFNRIEYLSNEQGSLVLLGSYSPITFGYFAVDVERGDFDGDGIDDLVLAGSDQVFPYAGRIQVLTGDGAGGFNPQPTQALAWDSPIGLRIVAGDVNGDGLDDVVAHTWLLDEIQVLTTGGGSQIIPPTPGWNLRDAALGDMDGDGLPDLVTLEFDTSVPIGKPHAVLRLNGSGAFGMPSATPVSAVDLWGLELGDADQDGDLDLLSSDPTFGKTDLLMIPGDGSGGLGAPIVSTLVFNDWLAADLDLEQVDEDGRPDVVLSFLQAEFGSLSGLVMTALGDGTGTFQVEGRVSLPAGEIAFGELSGTGSHGILTAAGHVIPVGRDGELGGLGVEPPSPLLAGSLQAILDFDRDGLQDLAIHDSSSTDVRIHFSDGEGGFSGVLPIAFLPPAYAATRMEAADVDGDGWTDLILFAGIELQTLLNQGGAGGSLVVTDLSGLLPGCSLEYYDLTVGDIDGDGRADLVRGSNHFMDAALAFGQPDGSFVVGCLPLTGFPGGIAIAELTGGGLADIVFVDRNDSGITILPGLGSPLFGPPIHKVFLSPKLWVDVATGDIDRDGDVDVIASTKNGLAVLKNDGLGDLTVGQNLNLGKGPWEDIQVVDMNGDDWPEVVARHEHGYASFWVLENDGGKLNAADLGWDFSAGGSGSADAASIDVGDLDGDGYPDMLVGGYFPQADMEDPIVYLNRSGLRADGVPSAGHTVEMLLDLPASAGQPYLVLASLQGTWPGIPLPGGLLPLNPDPVLFNLSAIGGGVFLGFLGTLDVDGRGQAQVAVPPVFLPPISLDFAFGAWDATIPGTVRTSNAWHAIFQ